MTLDTRPNRPTKLLRLYQEQAQSPWLDNLKRSYLSGGELHRMVTAGVRGVTANPTIFTKAILGSSDYDEQYEGAIRAGRTVREAYWELVVSDVQAALGIMRPLYDDSHGADGFVSVEIDPALAADTIGTIQAAREVHQRISEPNLLVKIPATAEGVPAIRRSIAEGRSINVTLIFSLERYRQVIEAYLSGLEEYVHKGGDPSTIHGVASFFVSRVDEEVDRRLEVIGTEQALALRGRTAIAQAKLAYRLFKTSFSGERWDVLASMKGRPQRPLWASTSTKNSAYPDTMYVDGLIGPETITTLPETTIEAFEAHGSVGRTIDDRVDEAASVLRQVTACGVDLNEVGQTLEMQGVAKFARSIDEVLGILQARAVTRS